MTLSGNALGLLPGIDNMYAMQQLKHILQRSNSVKTVYNTRPVITIVTIFIIVYVASTLP